MAYQQNPYGPPTNGPPPAYTQQPSPFQNAYGGPPVNNNFPPPPQAYNNNNNNPYQSYNYPPQNPTQQDYKPPYPQQPGYHPQQDLKPPIPQQPGFQQQQSPYQSPYGSPYTSPQPSPHASPSLLPSQPAGTEPLLTLLLPRRPGTNGAITNAATSAALYTYRTHKWSKPHITLTSVSGQDIGNLTLHSLSTRIDAVLHGRPVALEGNGMLKSGHHFNSPAQGGVMKWKNDGMSVSKKLMLQQGGGQEVQVARWEVSTWRLKKEGKLMLQTEAVRGGVGLDEVVLSLLAELETDRRTAAAAHGASGGGGAGC